MTVNLSTVREMDEAWKVLLTFCHWNPKNVCRLQLLHPAFRDEWTPGLNQAKFQKTTRMYDGRNASNHAFSLPKQFWSSAISEGSPGSSVP